MTLPERIDSDLKEAMKAKDTARLGVLRMLKSALKYSAIEKSGTEGQLDVTEATQVIRKQVKQRQDSIESFEKGGRAELAEKEQVLVALRLVSFKLNVAQRRTQGTPQINPIRNQHRIG